MGWQLLYRGGFFFNNFFGKIYQYIHRLPYAVNRLLYYLTRTIEVILTIVFTFLNALLGALFHSNALTDKENITLFVDNSFEYPISFYLDSHKAIKISAKTHMLLFFGGGTRIVKIARFPDGDIIEDLRVDFKEKGKLFYNIGNNNVYAIGSVSF